jgi:predicted nucleic acid-binding protein
LACSVPIGIDPHIADRWGRLMACAGRPLPEIDGLLAATALQHDLTLVTRNTKDFTGSFSANGQVSRARSRRH